MNGGNLADFVARNVPSRCDLASAVMEYTAWARGLEVERVNRALAIVRCVGMELPFLGLHGPDSSSVARLVCQWLDTQRALFDSYGVPMADGSVFPAMDEQGGLRFAGHLSWPVTVRSAHGVSRRGVTENVRDRAAFSRAWRRAKAVRARRDRMHYVVVERHIEGDRLQVYVVDQEVQSVVQLVPARVVGDGHTSVEGLIVEKNRALRSNPYLGRHPIPNDPANLDAYAEESLAFVPPAGYEVQLQSVPRAGFGIEDLTENADGTVIDLAQKALALVPSMPYGAVEIIKPASDEPVVSQVMFGWPPLGHFPTSGQPRDIAGTILNHYLREPLWTRARETHHVPNSAYV